MDQNVNVRIDKKLLRSLKKAAKDKSLSLSEVLRKAGRNYVGNGSSWYVAEAVVALEKYVEGIESASRLRKMLRKADELEETVDALQHENAVVRRVKKVFEARPDLLKRLRKSLRKDGGADVYRPDDAMRFEQENSYNGGFPEGFVAAQLNNLGVAPNTEETSWGQGDSPESDSEYCDSDVAGMPMKKSFMSDDMIARVLAKNLGIHTAECDTTGPDGPALKKALKSVNASSRPRARATGNTFASDEDFFRKRDLADAAKREKVEKFLSHRPGETLLQKSMIDRDGGRSPEELRKLAQNIARGNSGSQNDATESIAEMMSFSKLRKA